jgi:hypothetical protein
MFDAPFSAPPAPAATLGRRRIAVVGSGIAGLSAAWLLSRRHDVTLFEASSRLGGHSNTVTVSHAGREVPVDTGFIVYNERNYRNLAALFRLLKVETGPSDMSFAVSIDRGRIEYAGAATFAALFAQKRNLLRPSYLRMLADLARFYREMSPGDADRRFAGLTLGEVLERRRYSAAFRDHHLLPMAAAIWSGSTRAMLDFPAASFLAFCRNHGLLSIKDRPRWRTVAGGSAKYVARLAEGIGGIRTGAPVVSIRRVEGGVAVRARGDEPQIFDEVVIGAHADQALAMLDDAGAEERRVLSRFAFQRNVAILHRDPDLMPRRRSVWSSWNYMSDRGADPEAPVYVTYWMNRLQNIDPAVPLFVSLNAPVAPRDELVEARFDYDHPLFDGATLAAQAELPAIQGRRRVWFCGAWCGYGFHEDGLKAGLAVARGLGVEPPWTLGEAAPTPDARPLPVPALQPAGGD